MPRAKQKSAGTGRGRKKAAAVKSDNATVELETVAPTMSVDAVTSSASEDSFGSASPTSRHDQTVSSLVLPDCLDSAAAITIKEMLLSERGKAITLDASQVRRVGVQSLQVLVAAARAWRSDGLSYRLENPSPELLDTIALIGLPHQDLLLEGHQ